MIETVLGPVPAAALGPTSMHDHVLADSARLQRPGEQPPPPGSPTVRPETRDYLRRNMLAFADNLRLDDPDAAVDELRAAAAAGQRALVECTSWGLGPDHARLPDIARRSGMTIIVAYGTYIRATLPPEIAALDEDGLHALFTAALDDAVPGTGYRAGLLGILGATAGLPGAERGMLRAAAAAAGRAGTSVSVRLDPDARDGLAVLDELGRAGLSAERVIFTNADEFLDAGYWRELSDAGATLEMCFGTEDVHIGRVHNPTDAERVRFFVDAVTARPRARYVLGQSVWTKAQLARYGGYGYGRLLGTIVPELRRFLGEARVDEMLADEPRRLLDRGTGRPDA
ncbi:hypothetical protein [Microbacterium sp. T32]|uniref:phosphotriesterase family protein n=1 Tax=Microbacterium sp. T32 TaxID=1776083 RepID=UPI0009EDFAB0|nr:hypothetical protein [Microbacterium sp. T32]